MGKKKNIKPDVKVYVIKRALQERNALEEGKLTLDTLVKRISQELKNDKKTPPAPSTMKKTISKVRNREPSPEDQPWHMGTFKVYTPSAVGLAAIMEAYRFALVNKATLTIRQAKWIARLRPVLEVTLGLSRRELVALSILLGIDYARDEMLSEVTGEPLDTTANDQQLATGELRLYYSRSSPTHPTPDELEGLAELWLKTSVLDTKESIREFVQHPSSKWTTPDLEKSIDTALQRVRDNPELVKDKKFMDKLDSLYTDKWIVRVFGFFRAQEQGENPQIDAWIDSLKKKYEGEGK